MQFWGYSRKTTLNHAGEDDTEATPVPIPNTEVKLSCAESTCLVTDWEDRFRRLHFNIKFNIKINASLAQSVEQRTVNPFVVGSSPSWGAI